MWGAAKKYHLCTVRRVCCGGKTLGPPQNVACLTDVLSKWATGVLPRDRHIGENVVGEKPPSIIFGVVTVFSAQLHGLYREWFLEGTDSV